MPGRDDALPAVALDRPREGRLREVVRQHGEAQHRARLLVRFAPSVEPDQRVETVERVGPHVALRMPLRILRHADERSGLREMTDPSAIAQEAQPRGRNRGPGRPFHPLAQHALRRELGERPGDAPAQRDRLRRGIESEPRGELHPAQHAQRVLGEGGAGVPEHPRPQVRLAAEEIQHLAAMRIEHQRVDGEIAPGGGILRREGRIELHGEPFVARSDLRIAPRHREIEDLGTDRQLHHAEGSPDQVGTSPSREHPGQPLVAEPEDLHVEVLAGHAEQPVPHAAADQVRMRQFRRSAEDAEQRGRQSVEHGAEPRCPRLRATAAKGVRIAAGARKPTPARRREPASRREEAVSGSGKWRPVISSPALIGFPESTAAEVPAWTALPSACDLRGPPHGRSLQP